MENVGADLSALVLIHEFSERSTKKRDEHSLAVPNSSINL